MRGFHNLTVHQRLNLIGLGAGLGMLLSGAVHLVSNGAISDISAEVSVANNQMEIVDNLSASVYTEFAANQKYIIENDPDAKALWEKISDGNDAVIEQLVASFPDQAMRSLAEELRMNMVQFDSGFIALAEKRERLGLNESLGLQGKLRAAVHEVEAELKGAPAELMVSMLMMRRHEKDFMLRGAHKYLDKMAKESAHFSELLSASGLPKRKQIAEAHAHYQSTFVEFADLTEVLARDNHALSEMYSSKVRTSFDQMDTQFAAYINDLNAKKQHIKTVYTTAYWVLLVMVMMALGIFIRFVSRSISLPICCVADAMGQMERGQIEPIELNEGGDLGEMVDSVIAFQNQMRDTFRLRQVVAMTPQASMLADAKSQKIVYMNPAAISLFRTIESFLPCKVEQMIGSHIDVFHAGQENQRQVLANPDKLPLTSSFVAAGRSIRFSAHAVNDPEGNLESILVTCNDFTEQAKLSDSFQSSVGGVIAEITASSEQLLAASRQLAQSAENSVYEASGMSGSAAVARDNVMTVASAAEQLAASVANITDQIEEAARISDEAVESVSRSSLIVSNLAKSSAQIGDVIGLIRDVANQTNLLALNASIEAARAGDAGRGFAVVANEVKELAGETAKATEQISRQIETIQNESGNVSAAIDGIGEVIERMNVINKNILDAAEQQNVATSEIAKSAQFAAEATANVSGAVNGVSDAAVGTGKSAEELTAMATLLRDKGEDLNHRVGEFMVRVRG